MEAQFMQGQQYLLDLMMWMSHQNSVTHDQEKWIVWGLFLAISGVKGKPTLSDKLKMFLHQV
jgi:hypothetical protein